MAKRPFFSISQKIVIASFFGWTKNEKLPLLDLIVEVSESFIKTEQYKPKRPQTLSRSLFA